ncbi:hypothetical protein [Janthinobacterium fluminis]|uniref:Regulatory protein, RpfE type n=1 Tax=Janthinobacterium fluminis TaxID=2987524 RepID=A0ABT5JV34_9BURK|nr:hypothetical protein [Janthinobacterium fluminis]MDC8756579.1 hypothetical protein [Janthinobacterium fluminis]
MKQLTVALPFALPPPELAADLQRALQTPALAALLSRTCQQQFSPFDNATRVLPHEAWLAHALGLAPAPDSAGAAAPFAPTVMRGFGQAPESGHWLLVHPVHVQIARNHLLMGDQRQLPLDEADARALFDAAQPYFDEIGKTLLYGDAHTWFVRADDWTGLRTASPDAATGQNLTAWMPEGEQARASRKLQNEVQMLWHEHPVNVARQARGLAPVNSFWLWGGAGAAAQPAAPLFTADVPAWLAALAAPGRRAAGAEAVLGQPDERAVVALGGLVGAGLAADWSNWLLHMQRLEQEWFAPLLAALKGGRLGRLTLVLSNRDAYAEFSSSKNAQRKFWRPHTLNKLST